MCLSVRYTFIISVVQIRWIRQSVVAGSIPTAVKRFFSLPGACGHIQSNISEKEKKSRNQEKCGALSYSVVYKFHTVQASGFRFRIQVPNNF